MSVLRFEPYRDPSRELDRLIAMAAPLSLFIAGQGRWEQTDRRSSVSRSGTGSGRSASRVTASARASAARSASLR